MILIKLQGGLGNQMFQYATASILAKKNKTKVVIDDSIYNSIEKHEGYTPRNFELSIFDNLYVFAKKTDVLLFEKLSLANKIKKKIKFNYPKKFMELQFEFCPKVNSLKTPVYLTGYFQSFKYFLGFEDYVRSLFMFQEKKLSQENLNLISVLKKENTVAIHVRRGDYVTDEITNQFHGACSLEYYSKAIALVSSKIINPTLVFFSDDSEWVEKKFESVEFNKMFISHNKGTDSWVDMFLMSVCYHNIIANSSFSWWAAWLNEYTEKIIIAPKNWFVDAEINTNDLIPAEWVRL